MIRLTQQAILELRNLLEEKRATDGEGLRLRVERGGCAGMQYTMKLDRPGPGDEVIEAEGVRVIVDPGSLEFLGNVTVDHVDTLADSGFKIVNPDAARSCGCGTSFEPVGAGRSTAGV